MPLFTRGKLVDKIEICVCNDICVADKELAFVNYSKLGFFLSKMIFYILFWFPKDKLGTCKPWV